MLDIKHIADENGMSKSDLAVLLFPNNARPVSALMRVVRKETYLDENQIYRLATAVGKTIAELYADPFRNTDDMLYITMGDIKAYFCTDSFMLFIHKGKEMIHETVILKRGISITELKQYITTIQQNHG